MAIGLGRNASGGGRVYWPRIRTVYLVRRLVCSLTPIRRRRREKRGRIQKGEEKRSTDCGVCGIIACSERRNDPLQKETATQWGRRRGGDREHVRLERSEEGDEERVLGRAAQDPLPALRPQVPLAVLPQPPHPHAHRLQALQVNQNDQLLDFTQYGRYRTGYNYRGRYKNLG